MNETPTWERTPTQNLLRNSKSGRYYGRWTISGKQKWVKLGTNVYSVAKLRLADEAAKIERSRKTHKSVAAGTGTVGDLMRFYEERTKADTELAPASIVSRQTALKKILKTWPEVAAMKPSQVTPAAVREWVTRFKAEGTSYRPKGATTIIKGNSATSVNRSIDTLRRVMDIAIDQGSIHSNPLAVRPTEGRLKKKVTQKRLVLPSKVQVQGLYAAMETNGAVGGWGQEAADFCRFLNFSGCRLGEVSLVTWSKVDWQRKQMHVPGYKTESSDRIIPLFPDLEALLLRVKQRRLNAARYATDGQPSLKPTDRVFRLSECQKTIDAACGKSGCPRITHHDFRHLFATMCIEAGVDIPTVSRWLGHNDGGALAMKTYGHLRQEHSQAQAMRVQF